MGAIKKKVNLKRNLWGIDDKEMEDVLDYRDYKLTKKEGMIYNFKCKICEDTDYDVDLSFIYDDKWPHVHNHIWSTKHLKQVFIKDGYGVVQGGTVNRTILNFEKIAKETIRKIWRGEKIRFYWPDELGEKATKILYYMECDENGVFNKKTIVNK